MSFDMNKLMEQAAAMQAQVQQMQEDAKNETAEASVGGGMVKVTANGAGEVLSITISPDAIDPSDPEALGDLVLAGVNEALRSANAKVEAKAQQMQADLLGGLGLPGLGG
jgi:DNA-binding YbaB/EbfC family protein